MKNCAGIIGGLCNSYTFTPNNKVTREEAASIQYDAIRYIEKQTEGQYCQLQKALVGIRTKTVYPRGEGCN